LSPTFGYDRNTCSSVLPAKQDKINGSSTLCGEDCKQVTLEAIKEGSSPGTDDDDDAFDDDDDGGDGDDDEGI
jgi:hypothetical protein